jgi:alpha-D-ribose 1-methylphosphonate 5-triphosphate synthase subunit PhnH
MAERGFDQPVLAAQQVFRALLTALSEPGRVLDLAPACAPPAGLDPAAAAILLALADADTPVWLDAAWSPAADFVRFHTGAPLVAAPEAASFLLAEARHRPALAALEAGSAEYPDRSATLILAVDGFADGPWRLKGPGIAQTRGFGVAGIDASFAAEWRANHARFPQGVDVFFAARTAVAGLPRSTVLEG